MSFSMINALLGSFGRFVAFSQILFVLPLSLDVMGKECFLALSAALSLYYATAATAYLIVRNTRYNFVQQLFTLAQFFAIPFLLLFLFNLYSSDWFTSSKATTVWKAIRMVPYWWEKVLTWSTPVFVLLEGISTLLCIQAVGQLSRHVVERRDESFSLLFLIGAAATYVMSFYFLWSSYGFAAQERISATLIGVALTSVAFLSGIAFTLKKSSPVECSLIMAYVVYNFWWLSSESMDPVAFFSSFRSAAEPPLPPMILQSVTAVVSFISHTFGAAIDFLLACSSALPLPVFVTLVYRVAVLYFALRIIVAIKRANSGFPEDGGPKHLSDEEPLARTMTIFVAYSRLILVAVYTHLLLLNNEGNQTFWRWTNVFVTLVLWGIELIIGRDDDDDTIITGMRLKDD